MSEQFHSPHQEAPKNTVLYGIGKAIKDLGPKAWEKRAQNVIDTKIVPHVSSEWQAWLDQNKNWIAPTAGWVATGAEVGIVAGVAFGGYKVVKKVIEKFPKKSAPEIVAALPATVTATIAAIDPGKERARAFFEESRATLAHNEALRRGAEARRGVVLGEAYRGAVAERPLQEPVQVMQAQIAEEKYKQGAKKLREQQIGEPSTYRQRAEAGGRRWDAEYPKAENPTLFDQLQKKLSGNRVQDEEYVVQQAGLELDRRVFGLSHLFNRAYREKDVQYEHAHAKQWFVDVLSNIQILREQKKHRKVILPLLIGLHKIMEDNDRVGIAAQILQYGFEHLPKDVREQLRVGDPRPDFSAKAAEWIIRLGAPGADVL